MRLECANCGKIIEGRGSMKYCSDKCAKDYKRHRPGKVESNCLNCGIPVIGNAGKKFCGNLCNQKYLKKFPQEKKIVRKKEPNKEFFDWADYNEGII